MGILKRLAEAFKTTVSFLLVFFLIFYTVQYLGLAPEMFSNVTFLGTALIMTMISSYVADDNTTEINRKVEDLQEDVGEIRNFQNAIHREVLRNE